MDWSQSFLYFHCVFSLMLTVSCLRTRSNYQSLTNSVWSSSMCISHLCKWTPEVDDCIDASTSHWSFRRYPSLSIILFLGLHGDPVQEREEEKSSTSRSDQCCSRRRSVFSFIACFRKYTKIHKTCFHSSRELMAHKSETHQRKLKRCSHGDEILQRIGGHDIVDRLIRFDFIVNFFIFIIFD